MRIPFQTLDPLYRSKTFREKFEVLQSAMTGASASVAVVTAYARKKLSEETAEEDIDEITDRLVEMADAQELVVDQRALMPYSLLVFSCKVVRKWTLYRASDIMGWCTVVNQKATTVNSCPHCR